MKKRFISILVALSIVCSALVGLEFSAFAATKEVTVINQKTLYEWNLTDYKTFWSVSGEASPLTKSNGNNSACNFTIDENGAYMLPKAEWVAFVTTGSGNNIDLSDAANTEIVIEYETQVSTTLIIKADLTSGDGDNFQECFFQSHNGTGAITLNIKDLKSNKFGNKAIDVKTGYVSLQLMTTKGSEGTAVTWKTAKVVKYEKAVKNLDTNCREITVKDYALTSGSSKGIDISDIHTGANPSFSADGISMNASSQWVGVSTVDASLDVSDPTTKIVAEVANPNGCNIAYKLVSSAIATRIDSAAAKELSVNASDGTFEIYLNSVYSQEQMNILSDGKIKLQLLLGSTGKPVVLKSLKLVKEVTGQLPQEEFASFRAIHVYVGAGTEPVLPDTVRITTVKGRTADVSVTWERPEGYNCNIPGDYTFTAKVDEQSLNDNSVIYDSTKNGAITATVTIKASLTYYELPVTKSEGWTHSGTDQYGTYIFDENGLSITPSSLLGYTNSNITVENVNLDVVQGISYSITVNGAKWAIKVRNLTTGDPQIASGEIASGGEGFYDFSDRGWTGVADLEISLFSVGTDKTATYHRVVLDKKPVAKDSFVIDTTNPYGWNFAGSDATASGENDGGAYSFSDKGLSLTSKGSYYSMSYMVNFVDLDKVKGLLYYIDAPNSRWEIKIANVKRDQEIQIGGSWDGTLGTALDYFDFSSLGWSGTSDLKISVFVIVSGSDATCVFKNLQLLQMKPNPMPEIPKETAKTSLSLDLTDYAAWSIGGKKLSAASDSNEKFEYAFSASGLDFKSKVNANGVFYSSMASTYTNIDLNVLRCLYYKVSVLSGERWDIKIYNLSKKNASGQADVVTVSGSWEGMGGSDEGYFAIPDTWIGACDIKIEIYAFTSDKYKGSIHFSALSFASARPASPDSVTIDFSDYSAFNLSGGAVSSGADYKSNFGTYNFAVTGLTMSSERFKANDGSMQFWCDADKKIKNIDLSKTDTIEFNTGLTLGNWTIQVKNLSTGETVNYAKVVKPSDQAWSGVEVPKKSFFNFVKAAKDQLGVVWSGKADILVKFQALNIGKGSNVVFRSAKIVKGPSSIPTVTAYNFDFSNYEGWVIQNEGLVTKAKGTSSDKVATYNFSASGLTLKTQKQKVGDNNIFYTKFSYSIDYVDFDKLNAMTVDVTGDDARWDIAVFCSTAPAGKNTTSLADGKWNGTGGSISGTKSFKNMGWTGIGTLTVQIIGLDMSDKNEIFVKSLSLGTGETTITGSEGGIATSAEELEYATIKCPSMQSIKDLLNDKNRFDVATDIKKVSPSKTLPIILASSAIILLAGGFGSFILIKRRKNGK